MKEIEELIKKVEKGYKAEITLVEKTTSEKYFGKTKYDDREGYEVTVEVKEEGVTWTEFFNIPKPLGIQDSKVYKFKQKYGELPKAGVTVNAIIVDGFFRVEL